MLITWLLILINKHDDFYRKYWLKIFHVTVFKWKRTEATDFLSLWGSVSDSAWGIIDGNYVSSSAIRSFALPNLKHDDDIAAGHFSLICFSVTNQKEGCSLQSNLLTSSADSAKKNPRVFASILTFGPGLMQMLLSEPSSARDSTAISSNFSLRKQALKGTQ